MQSVLPAHGKQAVISNFISKDMIMIFIMNTELIAIGMAE